MGRLWRREWNIRLPGVLVECFLNTASPSSVFIDRPHGRVCACIYCRSSTGLCNICGDCGNQQCSAEDGRSAWTFGGWSHAADVHWISAGEWLLSVFRKKKWRVICWISTPNTCALWKLCEYSETRLLRTPKGKEKEYVLNKVRSIHSAIYPKCDVRHWESERYNRVYVLTRVRTNWVSLYFTLLDFINGWKERVFGWKQMKEQILLRPM